MSSTGHLPELDLLRSQVADLARDLAERDRALREQSRNLAREGQDLREQSEMLRAIVESTASETGEDFFPALVIHLTSVLGVQYAVIGEVHEDSIKTIRTIAVSAGGALADNFEYALMNTPCETALAHSFACFERDVQISFPVFERLAQLNVEGYCGVPIRTKAGLVIGLLAIMDTKPLCNREWLKSLMTVFASRAGAELQRLQTETKLRQQGRHLVEAQALAHLGSWDWDIDSGDVQWSDEQFRIFGHEPRAIAVTYDTFLTSLHPDDHDRILAAINDALLGKRPYDVECRIIRPNGDIRFIHSRGDVHRDASGHPLSMAGIALDITERKQAEEVLRASEERWQLTMRGSNDGSWDWNIRTGDIYFSSRWKTMRGFEDHEVQNHIDEWRSRIHPDDLDRVLQSFDAYLARRTGEFCEEYRVQRKDGSYMWILDRGVALWADDGTPLRMAGSETDITERKRVEEDRQKALMLLSNVINTTPDFIFVKDRNLRTILCNNVFAQAIGKTPEDMIGHTDIENGWDPELVHGNADKGIRGFEADDRQALIGKVVHNPADPANVGSETRIFDTYKVPLLSETGDVMGVLGIARDITARKQVEEALRISQDKLRQSLQASNTGLWEWNTETNEVTLSREWKFQLGYEDREVMDAFESWESRLHPDDHARAMTFVRAYLAHPVGNYQQEFRLRHKDGTYRWIEARASFATEPDGRQIRLLGSHTDITERKRMEEALSAALHDLQNITETIPDIMYTLDLEGKVVNWNRRVWTISGFSPEEMMQRPALAFAPEDERPRLADAMRRVFEAGAAEVECHLLTKDGRTIPYHWTGAALKDRHGRLIGMTGVGRDITALKQAEAAVRESEARYRTLVELSPSGVFVFCEGRTVYINHMGARIMGATDPKEILERPAFEFIHPDYHLEVRENVQRLLTGGASVHRAERIYLKLDGTPVPVQVEAARITWNGRPAILGLFSDITERKRAEEALRVSEERYARATAVGKVGVWELDATTGTYYGDTNLKTLFGYAADELSTDPYTWLNLVHPDDQSIAMDHWQRIVNRETDDYNYELRMLKKDGTVIWTDVRGHAIRNHEGQVTHLFGATVDITERKQAQDALIQSERQLRTVLDALPVGVWFTDQAGKLMLSNPVAKQIWSNIKQIGLQTPNNQSGWWETIGPADELHRWTLSHVLTTGVASLYETLDLECFDGTKKTIRNSTVPVRDEAGNILGAIVLNEDITMLRRAQETLKLIQFSVDHAVEGFFWISPGARVLHVNDAACHMLEYTRDELMTMTVHDINPTFPPEAWPASWEELKQKGSLTFEWKLWSKTGLVLDTEVSANYLQYEGREYNCVIMRGIGERKKMESVLRQRGRDLSAALEERERISQDLHDGILQSLYAVGLGLEACKPLLAQQHEKATANKLRITFNHAIGQLNHVMAEVRNFIAGLESQVMQGGDFSTALRTMVQTMFASSSIKCRVMVDEAATRRISTEQAIHLMNVVREGLSNSLRHSQAKKTTVSLKHLTHSLRLSVTDDGIGFIPSTVHGVGHGLANMAARAQKIGGQLAVRSRPRRGTKVLFDLPKEILHAHD